MDLTQPLNDEEFDQLISEAMDELPEQYIAGLKNVLVTYADEPTEEQRINLRLHCNETLLGLYEGVPLTARGDGYANIPDRITLFKLPIQSHSHDEASLRAQIKHTLWHEIAHYYGLDHDRIHAVEQKNLG